MRLVIEYNEGERQKAEELLEHIILTDDAAWLHPISIRITDACPQCEHGWKCETPKQRCGTIVKMHPSGKYGTHCDCPGGWHHI